MAAAGYRGSRYRLRLPETSVNMAKVKTNHISGSSIFFVPAAVFPEIHRCGRHKKAPGQKINRESQKIIIEGLLMRKRFNRAAEGLFEKNILRIGFASHDACGDEPGR